MVTAAGREDYAQLAELIRNSSNTCALTGAGISVESGISDFRSAGGLWERFDPMDYAHIDAFRRDPARVWRMLVEMDEVVSKAEPNPAHFALAQLEEMGLLATIITQNIDNLHQRAGSKNVVEFHGSHATLSCFRCGQGYGRDEVDLSQTPPRCACGGPLKPDVVFFGEAIPPQALEEATAAASSCRLMLVIGTSAVVAPASLMPVLAARSGATVVEINVEPTELTRGVADITILGRAGRVLPHVVELVRGG